jgi:sialidase-1
MQPARHIRLFLFIFASMKNAIIFCAMLLAHLSVFGQVDSNSIVNVFQQGESGYSCFRIPSIVSCKSGALIAIAEGRKNNCSDTGNIDLVMKKSIDGGRSWSNVKVVWDDGDNVCGNPVPVVDVKSGKIVLVATWNYGTDKESDIIAGTSVKTRRVFVLSSDDEGQTWSTPKDITSQVKSPSWGWYATGPCHGIQLQKSHKGRIVVPANHTVFEDRSTHSHLIYSDDCGVTWHIGGIVKEAGGNESSVVELKNGNLMLNMRNYDKQHACMRAYAISSDGGKSLSEMSFLPELIEPICQGSTLNYLKHGRPSKNILFSNPSSTTNRKLMTIKLSKDNGRSWRYSYLVYPEHSAYSDMVNLPDGKVGLLFEYGKRNYIEAIGFVTVNVDDIMKE